MNFVEHYYEFKHKWYLKIGSLLFDFYISKVPNNNLEKIKYDYLDNLISAYINNEKLDESKIEKVLKQVDSSSLNKLEYELLKYVIHVSDNYQNIKFNSSDYVYFAMILEITGDLYNSAFIGVNENLIYKLLKENLFRFEFVDFKRKQTKVNLLIRYLKYINKNESLFFGNIKNKNVEINVTSLSNHRNYFIIDIVNKLPDLNKYDAEMIESVIKNNDYLNKLFILNFNLLVEQLVYLLEREKFDITKVIFNLDNYHYNREAINYINKFNSVINNKIMFCSKNKSKLDIISNSFAKCVYLKDNKITANDYKDITVIVKKSFWNNKKIDNPKYQEINFITINDNIIYKFEKED